MIVNYQLTKSDFLEHQLYESSKSDLQRKRRTRSRIIVPVIYVLFGLLLWYLNDDKGIVIGSTILGILWFIFFPMYSKWRYRKHIHKFIEENFKKLINRPVEMHFDDNFVVVKDYSSETKISGNDLKELIETSNHYFMKLITGLSIIVPKHYIENEIIFKNLVMELGAKYVDERTWKWK